MRWLIRTRRGWTDLCTNVRTSKPPCVCAIHIQKKSYRIYDSSRHVLLKPFTWNMYPCMQCAEQCILCIHSSLTNGYFVSPVFFWKVFFNGRLHAGSPNPVSPIPGSPIPSCFTEDYLYVHNADINVILQSDSDRCFYFYSQAELFETATVKIGNIGWALWLDNPTMVKERRLKENEQENVAAV